MNLMGFAYRGRPIAGIIGRPFTGEIIWGIVGLGAFGFNNADKLESRKKGRKLSRIICTTRSHFKPSIKAYISACKPTGFVRSGGSGCKILMVIEGIADAYVFPSNGTKKWDICAGEAILLSLGGKLTKPDGSLYDYNIDNDNIKIMNECGFIATIFGDKYHETYLENNLKIFQLDLVLFGATGYTGKLAVEYIIDQYIYQNKNIKAESGSEEEKEKKLMFGIAGRSKVKLQNVLYEIKNIGKYNDIKDDIDRRISIIECDAFTPEKVESMIQKTSVVVTTVGPYAKYGENIINACCKYGVDYVDLTGEFSWVKRMINKYNDDAIRSHARIVNFGGCVAALTDCAIYAGVEKIKQEQEDEKDLEIISILPGIKTGSKSSSSGGTIASWLNSINDGSYKYDIHDAYFLCDNNDYKWQSLNKQPKSSIFNIKYNTDLKMYSAPFIYGPVERMVFMRSNELLSYYYGEKVKIYENIMFIKKLFLAYIISFFLWLIPLLISFAPFRYCIIKLVKSLSYKQGKGPKKSQLIKQKWREIIEINTNKKNLKCKVDIKIFGDYGYLNTSKLLIEQGILFSLQRNNPKIKNIKGGFLTPAAAFKSSLPKRLHNKLKEFDISYKIIKDE